MSWDSLSDHDLGGPSAFFWLKVLLYGGAAVLLALKYYVVWRVLQHVFGW